MTGKILSIIALLIIVVGGIYVYATDTQDTNAGNDSVSTTDNNGGNTVEIANDSDDEDEDGDSDDDDGTPAGNTKPDNNSSASGQTSTGTSGGNTTSGGMTLAIVATHNNASSCWTAIDGKVYDLTKWINQHPGGRDAILSLCGKDGSSAFNAQHGGQRRPESELASFFVGVLQ